MLFLHAAFLAIAVSIAAPSNIVFILADDLDTEYDQWLEHFPKIKRLLVDDGATFTNAYASVGLCCPSRTSMLTGRYAHNNQILTNNFPNGCFQDMHDKGLDQITIAKKLQDEGYQTALFGKYLNGYPGKMGPNFIPIGWNEWYAGDSDIYRQYNYILNQNGKLYYYGHQPSDYEEDVLKGLVTNFIRRTSHKPFFIWYASKCPHRPAEEAMRFKHRFKNMRAPRPQNFNKPNPQTWTKDLPVLNQSEILQIDHLYQKRLRSMLALEDTIEAIMEALKNSGQLNNTFVIFASDNGYHFGSHGSKWGKNTGFREDVHIPLIIKAPGVKKTQIHELVLNIDLPATFAHIAKASFTADGRSLLPLLMGEKVLWRKAILLEHGCMKPSEKPRPFSGIMTKDQVLLQYEEDQERELYDQKYDPFQQQNLAALGVFDPSLSSWLHELKTCSNKNCHRLENHPSRH